ncbi:MAG: type II toxin-antitoxin system VapC family toxin [Desulfobacterales bacterium]|jgi:tRNA(fMet)-specific endonuclease VapC
MKYILDTNTLIYFFKGLGDVSKKMLAQPPSEIAIPTVVLFELEVGIAKSTSPRKRKSQLQEFTALVNVLPFGIAESKFAAQIRVKLEKQGLPIGPYDVLIAATAMANNMILVTHNQKEFGRIESLKIEDWF